MTPATLSVGALLLVMAASFTTRLNVGVLAVGLAWLVATYGAGWKADAVLAAFPSSLFVTLLGVTLLFGCAQANGTMAALTQRALHLCRGRAAWLPFLLFGLACAVSTMGPGAVAAIALLAPLGMAAGARASLPPLLTALMLGNGANAGNLSPFSAVGVIVAAGMAKAGVPGHEWAVWSANFVAHALAACCAWLLFGGAALFRHDTRVTMEATSRLSTSHRVTLAVVGLWVVAVVVGKVPLGLAAFVAAAGLVLLHAADDTAMIRQVPWAVIVMVCGVSLLVAVLEGTGGLDLFSSGLSQIARPSTVNGLVALVTGTISTYSSTSGVVYPTFLPVVPSLVQKIGGGDPLQVALSINVGAALVDVSPLSTLGALCIAALPQREDARRLFRGLLLWGLAMTVAGALFCQLAIGLFTG
jgi:di/tricarboxylate transporter